MSHTARGLKSTETGDEASAPGRPLSVAYVTPGWPPDAFANGIIPYIGTMADTLRGDGHRVTVISQHTVGDVGPGVYSAPALPPGRSLVRRGWDGLMGRLLADRYPARRYARGLVGLVRRAVAEQGIEVIEMEEAFGWSRRVQRGVSVPVVVRLHGPWFLNGAVLGVSDDAAFRRRVRDEGGAIRAADGITAPSRDVLEQTRAYYGLALENAQVIAPTTPVLPAEDRWRREACDPDLVLFIGRFDRHKGGDVVIDAFARLAPRFPRARLCFVGPDRGIDLDGRRRTLTEYLDERLPGALESGRVEWLGQQPHARLAALRRRALVTVVSSRYENFPLTALEAMAAGAPLVASGAGGIKDFCRDGEHGLLCRPGDPDDLAEKVARLLADPALAARLGHEAALEGARRYSPEVLAAEALAYYRDVLQRYHRRVPESSRA